MRSTISQLTLHKLEIFCTVAEIGSVSQAAERHNIAQPVVSAHISSLASKVGFTLTERSGRNIILTSEGQRVYQWAREVIMLTRELEYGLAGAQQGLVGKAKIGASMTLGSYVLPGLVAGLRSKYPHGEMAVNITSPVEVTSSLREGTSDFAITNLDPRQDVSGLKVQKLAYEHLVLVASPTSSFKSSEITNKRLSEVDFVSAQSDTPRREIEEILLMELGVSRRRVVMEFGHAEAIKQAVRAGAGLALLFRSSIKDELLAGTLKEIKFSGAPLLVPVFVIRREGRELDKFQTTLLNSLVEGVEDYFTYSTE